MFTLPGTKALALFPNPGPRPVFRNDVQTHCMRLFFEMRNMIEANVIYNMIEKEKKKERKGAGGKHFTSRG